jgi:CopA family copper-resistance protein
MMQDKSRRAFLRGMAVAGGGAGMSAWLPAWAGPVSAEIATLLPTVSGDDVTLTIARQTMLIDGRPSRAVGINGTVPAPLIRLQEGRRVRIHVRNALDVDSSLHWHGLLVPADQDGVPGVSYPGIPPHSSFTYDFPVRQSGTYWYHSHSGLQEQAGLYGPIVIDPVGADPVGYDREHVVVLSDHAFLAPESIRRKLKLMPGYFDFQQQSLAGLLAGRDQPLAERLRWGRMRMDPTDIADVTGAAYTYLINGHGPFDNWTALFTPGERVRLRFVNAASMTSFNVRIPGLPLTIVQADGQNVRPVETDEFQIGVAETYDVIVTPPDDRAYTLVGEAVDRSGMARATLAPRAGMAAAVPPLRRRPLATMKDMGMDMGGSASDRAAARGLDMTAEQNRSRLLASAPAEATAPSRPATPIGGPSEHAAPGAMAGMAHGGHGGHDGTASTQPIHGGMDMESTAMREFSKAPGVRRDAGVQTIAPMPMDRTGEPGQGLENAGHRVLVYRDLIALEPNPDRRAPSRSVDVHLTGNMERYMWSIDGVKMSDNMTPLPFRLGERVRVNLINDTMMTHPIHLHGHFFELVTGHGDHAPRKHTVNVAPGGKVTFDLTADNPGDWAFHCHMLFHMMAGMMRVVSVRAAGDAA